MTRPRRLRRASDSLGFSLIETLAALFLMGLILSALARLTAQWMPGWDRGFTRIQRSEAVGVALERIDEDLGAAEFIKASRDAKFAFFAGDEDAVTFVRSALGPNVDPGLEVVRLAQTRNGDEAQLIRSHARFVPGGEASVVLADPVVLLRSPFSVSFSFVGKDGAWKTAWHDGDAPPLAVLVTMRDAATGDPIGISRAVSIHRNASAEMTCRQAEHGCGDAQDQTQQSNGRASQ